MKSNDFEAIPVKNISHINKNKVIYILFDCVPSSKCSGLFVSAMRRADLFQKYFPFDIYFVSHKYCSNTNDRVHELIRSGKIVKMNMLNKYDYFQNIDRHVIYSPKIDLPRIQQQWIVKDVKGTNDVRIFCGDDRIMYCGRDADNRKLRYINHFVKNKKIRRDTFDTLGFVSKTEFLAPGSNLAHTIIYYRPDHTPAIMESFTVSDNKADLNYVHLLDEQGHVYKIFKKNEDFIDYFMQCITGDINKNHILIADRPGGYQKFFSNIKNGESKNKLPICFLHSAHIRKRENGSGDVLKDRHVLYKKIIVLTDKQKKDMLHEYNIQNIEVIPHAVVLEDKGRSLPRHDQYDQYKLLFVGRLSEEKAPDRAIDVLKMVLKSVSQAVLHFYGKGVLEESLKQRVLSENLSGSVVFHGHCNDMSLVFPSAAAMILTSNREGFSLVIQESMTLGCPVAAFDCDYGPSAMIEDGVNGFLVPPGDCATLAERVTEILQNPSLRNRLSLNARTSIQKFSQSAVAARWAEVLSDVMKKDTLQEGEPF